MARMMDIGGNQRIIGQPDRRFNEVEFTRELWRVLLGQHSAVIEYRTGEKGYKLKLHSMYTLESQRYNDSFIEGFLRKASNTLKMLSQIGRFASDAKKSRLRIDPLPMIPFRKAAQSFHRDVVSAIDSYVKAEMDIDHLDVAFRDISSHIDIVYTLYRPVIKTHELDRGQPVPADVQSTSSTIAFREEVEDAWRQFFNKLFGCPDSFHARLSIWNWIFTEFLNILPSYLDKITEFTDISIDSNKDRIVLTDDSRKEFAYFRILWSDRLVILVKRAFLDRKRLFARQKNTTTSIAKQWSVYFGDCLDRFKDENPDLLKLIEIKPTMIHSLLEKSCQLYVNQFSRLILNELQYKTRLVLRVKELQSIYSLHALVDQINRTTFEEHRSENRNTTLQAFKNSLNLSILPETTSKYWSVNLGDTSESNPYAFRIQYKAGWPVNLIISQQFLNNSNHVLQLLTRLFYYYTNYRAFAITCMFSGGSDSTITFTRKVQNFVLSFRQVLYRLFNCLVKKVGAEMKILLQIVETAINFNDLEANVNRWHENMRVFATESNFALSMENLFNCADSFISACKSMGQRHEDQPSLLEKMTCDNRRDFVLACESLTPSIHEVSVIELSSFEQEVSLIVSHITNDKFWQAS